MFMAKFDVLSVIGLCVTAVVAQTCLPATGRIDCHPGPFTPRKQKTECEALGCIYCKSDKPNGPTCYLPSVYGYTMDGQPTDTGNGFSVTLKRATNVTMFGSDSQTITLTIDFQSDYRLRIKFTDGSQRFEVPLQIDPAKPSAGKRLYDVEFNNDPVFSFKVIRKSSGIAIFDTSLGGLTFSDQFLQITTLLPSKNLYGIGENEQQSFRHNFDNFPVYPIFTKDQSPAGNANMYGAHPYYTVLENDGNAHSVVFVNSNAQEFVILPAPGVLYRTIGGILDIYIFMGPTPENTAQQYTEAIGRTAIPPYWALGFHLCRFGYKNLTAIQNAVNRTRDAEIPHDVQYGDIDIMDGRRDFTISSANFAGLPTYVKQLKTDGIKFITILDPAIAIEAAGSYRPYDLGVQLDVFIKNADGSVFQGKVWPAKNVAFPDYSKNSTREWWITLIQEFRVILEWDALWIDMNEPSNFNNGDVKKGCASNKYNNPPYVPKIVGGALPTKTLCMDCPDSIGIHYDTHSLYGWLESEPTLAAIKATIPGKRAYVLTRSTYIGSGRWASHWLGDNFSKWSNLKTSIIGTLQFNHFGLPFVGADICGFMGATTAQMCQRWQELGAFYPYARNHNNNNNPDQDPAVFGTAVAQSSKAALEIRYTYLPYLYTLFYYHYTQGSTVARALWHEFPTDTTAAGIDEQFLWGPGFLISPALNQDQTTVKAYFPKARWYRLRDGTEESVQGAFLNLTTPLDFINLHLRGGIVYPTQDPALNTLLSRQNDIGLTIVLDENSKSSGRLYYDDGESLDPIETGKYYLLQITYNPGLINGIIEKNGYAGMANLKLNSIQIFGPTKVWKTATVNSASVLNVTNSAPGVFKVTGLQLNPTENFKIQLA